MVGLLADDTLLADDRFAADDGFLTDDAWAELNQKIRPGLPSMTRVTLAQHPAGRIYHGDRVSRSGDALFNPTTFWLGTLPHGLAHTRRRFHLSALQ
jgi:hypothetical protein